MSFGQELRKISDKAIEDKYQEHFDLIRSHLKQQAILGRYTYSYSPKEPIRESILSLLANEFEGVKVIEHYYEYATDGYFYYEFDWKGAK